MKKYRVATLCSGYDSQCMALDRIRERFPDAFDYELVAWSEIDRDAIKAHNAVYPQWKDRNLGDMTKINWELAPDFDVLTYSTPCVDISSAGKQKGLEKGSGTNSALLWYVEEAIRVKTPKYLLMENVKALTNEKFLPYFNQWLEILEGYGYKNFYQVLDASHYGVGQHRERIFVVSILDKDAEYHFPESHGVTNKTIDDYLQTEVEEKYFLDQGRVENAIANIAAQQELKNNAQYEK